MEQRKKKMGSHVKGKILSPQSPNCAHLYCPFVLMSFFSVYSVFWQNTDGSRRPPGLRRINTSLSSSSGPDLPVSLLVMLFPPGALY